MTRERSRHFMEQLQKDVVRIVALLGCSDHIFMSSFERLTKDLKGLKLYRKIPREELEVLLERTDQKKWNYWTIHVITKGRRKWIWVD